MENKSTFYFGLALWAIFISSCQSYLISQSTARLEETALLKEATVAYVWMEAESGKILESYHPQKLMLSASVAKVLTSAAALHYLGENFIYQTDVFINGRIDAQGRLKGNLVIRGSGDPTLSNQNNQLLNDLLTLLRQKGIRAIDGSLVIDPFVFNYDYRMLPDGYIWADVGNYFAAPVCGFSVDQNRFTMRIAPGKNGNPVKNYSLEPTYAQNLWIENHLTYGAPHSGDQAWFYGGLFENKLGAHGTVPEQSNVFVINGAHPNPVEAFAQFLKQSLAAADVEVKEIGVKKVTIDAELPSLSWHSKPLKEWLYKVNAESDNFYAECLLQTIGAQVKKSGTREMGLLCIQEYIKNVLQSDAPHRLTDGSGLSPMSTVSADLLACVFKKLKANKSFTASMAVAGQTGTLAGFRLNKKLCNNAYGKSGSMSSVRNYTLYVESTAGKQYIASILVNHFTCPTSDVKSLIIKQLETWLSSEGANSINR